MARALRLVRSFSELRWSVRSSADDSQQRWRVLRPIRRACASPHPHRPQPRCHGVDQSELRRWKRGGETFDDDLFVPKQLGQAGCIGTVGVSPALTVGNRPCLFAGVRACCHAVRHATLPHAECLRSGRAPQSDESACALNLETYVALYILNCNDLSNIGLICHSHLIVQHLFLTVSLRLQYGQQLTAKARVRVQIAV